MTEQEQLAIEVSLTLTVGEVNIIMSSMDELPHKISRGIIDKIVAQAQPQVDAAASAVDEDEVEEPSIES